MITVEDKFVIYKWDGGPGGWTIVKSELKRRIKAILRSRFNGSGGGEEVTDEDIDVLLNGEKPDHNLSNV